MHFSFWSLSPYCARSWCSYNCLVSQIPSCERNWARWANITAVTCKSPYSNCKPATQPLCRRTLRRHHFILGAMPIASLLLLKKSSAFWQCEDFCMRFVMFSLNLACFSVYQNSFLFTKLAIYEEQYLIFTLNCFFQKTVLPWLVQFDLLLLNFVSKFPFEFVYLLWVFFFLSSLDKCPVFSAALRYLYTSIKLFFPSSFLIN